MNKTEWIKAVQERAHVNVGVSLNQVENVLNHALEVIQEEVADGHTVNLTGFGKFEAKATKGRFGRNPRTGEGITIPAGKKVVFKPGAELKGAVKS